MSKIITIEGKVVSGSNIGQKFVKLPWVKKQIITKFGFNPYFGTLNLRLFDDTAGVDLNKYDGIILEPETGYYKGKCFRALLMKRTQVVVVLPNVPNYPSNLLEIIAPVNLRKTLELKDGVKVLVSIIIE